MAVNDKNDVQDNSSIKKQRIYSSVEHIRAVAWLYGLETAKVQHASVLVLGCGDGTELLTTACAFPYASFTGIELATEVNAVDLQNVLAQGPDNLHLYSASLDSLFESNLGKFDYIVIQNSFSMLANDVTDAVLLLCKQMLTPQGVMAIDWSCQPGAKLMDMLRDAVQIHSGMANSWQEQIHRSREMLSWINQITHNESIFKSYIDNTDKNARQISDDMLSHYFLEGKNEASYLVEFNTRLENMGLSYVGDLQPASEHADFYDEKITEQWQAISAGSGKVLAQQYLDIAINRNRRFSLVKLQADTPVVEDNVNYQRLRELRFSGSFRRLSHHIRSVPNVVASQDGTPVATEDITTLNILDLLGEAWPYSLSFEQLVFHTRLPDDDPEFISDALHEDRVMASLKALFKKNIAGLHYQREADIYSRSEQHEIVTAPAIIAQLNARAATTTLVNPWHEVVTINDEERQQLLSGVHTVSANNFELLDNLHRKGLLTGSVLAWKHYYQKTIAEAELIHSARLACSLLLFSSDRSAGGFYTHAYETLAKKMRRDGNDDVSESVDKALVISTNKILIKGDNTDAIEHVAKHYEELSRTFSGNYYLYRFYKRVVLNESAILALCKMLSFQSTSLFIYSELAMALYENRMSWAAGRLARAILRCDRKSSPDWYLLGVLHKESKTFERAEYCARTGVELAPESRQMVGLLGSCLCEQAKTDEGIAFLKKSIRNQYADFGNLGGLAFTLTHSAKSTAKEILDCHLSFGEGAMNWAGQQKFSGYHPLNKDANRKLRLGFVSGDFRDNHPVSFFFTPIWDALDRSKFELYAYNSAPSYARNEGTDRFEKSADKWREILHTSATELAEIIKQDEIDILIDLAGHTGYNRLTTFALKPSPVQISWVGYHATTGLPTMDYYATIFPVPADPVLEAQFTEKLIYLSLPRNFSSKEENQSINSLPALEKGYFTFASFNRPNKVNDEVLDVWARVLLEVPSAHFIIANMATVMWPEITHKMETRGIPRERITLREATHMQGYLQSHNDVDLILDTFPFTGGTVTSHAAWMGVPTVSLAGETLVSRQGASIMYSLGLPDFVAYSKEEYIAKAVSWTSKLEELNAIRLSLRSRMQIEHNQKDLIAQYVEQMLRQCWQRYCDGQEPESFSVGDIYQFGKQNQSA